MTTLSSKQVATVVAALEMYRDEMRKTALRDGTAAGWPFAECAADAVRLLGIIDHGTALVARND